MQRGTLRNLALYPWYLSSTWEGISNPVWYLYLFVYKGMSLGEMAWLVLLGDGIIVLAEVPTGWVADRISRRFSILTGIILQATSAVLFIFGDSFFAFFLAMATCGLGDTFRSGADQALLYESCHDAKQASRFRGFLGHAMFIATVVMVISQISGGAIAHYISWELPFWLEVGFSTVGFITVLMMVEPPRLEDPQPEEKPLTRGNTGASNWMLRLAPLLLFAMVFDAFPELSHFHLPAELSTGIGFTPLHLGFVFAAFELLQGLGNKLGGSSRLSNRRLVFPLLALGMVACFIVFASREWLGLVAYLLARAGIDFLWGIGEPIISEEANVRASSKVRAMSLSVVNSGRRLLPLGLLPISAMLVKGEGYFIGHGTLMLGLVPMLAVAALWLVSGIHADSVQDNPR